MTYTPPPETYRPEVRAAFGDRDTTSAHRAVMHAGEIPCARCGHPVHYCPPWTAPGYWAHNHPYDRDGCGCGARGCEPAAVPCGPITTISNPDTSGIPPDLRNPGGVML